MTFGEWCDGNERFQKGFFRWKRENWPQKVIDHDLVYYYRTTMYPRDVVFDEFMQDFERNLNILRETR